MAVVQSSRLAAEPAIFFLGISPDTANANLPVTTTANYFFSNLTLANGNARGGLGAVSSGGGGGAGLGGAMFVNAGNVTLSNVAFTNNRAVGGGGTTPGGGGGGGGGMGGGGAGGASNPGGGGGFGIGANGSGNSSGFQGAFYNGTVGGNSGGSAFYGPGGINGGGGGGGGDRGTGGGGGVGGQNATGIPGNGGFGGGGGGGFTTAGANGGFGGGGGAGNSVGGNGGFGGGGASQFLNSSTQGLGGFGGGNATQSSSGGGLGAGGAIFLRDGATLNLMDCSFTGNTVVGGQPVSGFNSGQALGQAVFVGGDVTFTVNSGSVTLASTLGGDAGLSGGGPESQGSLTKAGVGTLILTATNGYSGGTIINSGTLLANNGGGATGLGNVTVQNTGILGGTGLVNGAVTANAGSSIAPGNGPGVLSMTNGVLFNAGSTFSIELNGTSVGSQYDRLAVNGSVTLTNPTLNGTLGFSPQQMDKFFILVNDGSDPINGIFSGLPQDSFFSFGGSAFQISYTGNSTTGAVTGGNDVVLIAVPEPITLGLLCCGICIGAGGVLHVSFRNRRKLQEEISTDGTDM